MAHLACVFQLLQCTGELAKAVIGYLYLGRITVDASTAAEIISLANLWQLPGRTWLHHMQMLLSLHY